VTGAAAPPKAWFDRERLARAADWVLIAIVVTLPYSTSATSLLVPLWLILFLPTIGFAQVRAEFARARSFLPAALALVMVAGLAWGAGTAAERSVGATSLLKLLALPAVIVHVSLRPDMARRAATAFVLGLLPLLALSYAAQIYFMATGEFRMLPGMTYPGVPFKDYIAQSGFFLLASVLLGHVAVDAIGRGDRRTATIAAGLLAAFLGNIAFVATGRTTLVVALVLYVLFVVQRFRGLRAAIVLAAGLAVIALLWVSAGQLRWRVLNVLGEVTAFQRDAEATSSGLRLAWYQRSLEFVREAPLLGHGTGSMPGLFRRAAEGQSGAFGQAAANPHNQLFWVAIQTGAAGALLLLAVWGAHFLGLRGTGIAAWTGTAALAQNVVGSLVNSHLSDFTQGWMYVFAIGIALGAVSRREPVPPP